MRAFIAIAQHMRPIDWAIVNFAIWGGVIHLVAGWLQ